MTIYDYLKKRDHIEHSVEIMPAVADYHPFNRLMYFVSSSAIFLCSARSG